MDQFKRIVKKMDAILGNLEEERGLTPEEWELWEDLGPYLEEGGNHEGR